ncbi:uncharacterized protein LOC135833209 isoform X2 [Planococcus citri]|uniref:uncharacterized protein LOC135833209 isoform X2 n=1 Tax=Planococcus citri TaxID=170843 RepID=UPI0031F8E326
MMKRSTDTSVYDCITNPSPGASYWIKRKRKIIYQIFKNEILDRTLPITKNKIKKVIAKFKEEEQPRNESRIRTFVHRLRREYFRSIEGTSGEENQCTGKCWYWNEDRRKIIRNIFKDELLDRSLRIQRPKIIDALTELKEEQNSKNESKIRTFVHRLREEDKEKTRRMALASKPDSVIVIKSFQENVSNSTQAEKQDEPQDDEEQFELSSDVQSFDDSDDSSNWTLQISDDGFHTCLT